MGVNHGSAHVFVAEEFLDGTDVPSTTLRVNSTVLEEMGGEGVAEGVGGDAFAKARFLNGLFDGALEGGWVEVMAEEALPPGPFAKHPLGAPRGRGKSGVAGELRCGEEVLPDEFAGGVGVFGCQGVWQVDFAEAGGEVFFVEEADAFDLTAQVRDDGLW